MFIVPMDAPGVTVRGLRQISGEAEFNEVFFDDVALDADAVVGGVGNGWGTALTVLMFERLTIGFGSDGFGSPVLLAQAIGADPAARADCDVRHRLGEVITELLAVRYNGYRALTALAKGQIPGPEAGLAKVTLVNSAIAAAELATDVLGPAALEAESHFSYLTELPARPEVGRGHRADPAQHDRRAGARAAGRAAPGQGCAVQRTARQRARGGGLAHELRPHRRAEPPAGGGAQRLGARQDDRGRARGAGGTGCAARPVAERRAGRLAGAADRRGPRGRRARAASTRCWSPRSAGGCSPPCRCSGCCRPPRS